MSVAAFICSQKMGHGIGHATGCPSRRPRPATSGATTGQRDHPPVRASGGAYGSPRITLDLHQAGWRVSKNTVAERMAELGLAGRPPGKQRSLTRQGKRPAAPDLVRRKFTAIAPDLLWCGDVTEIDTGAGKL